MSTWTMTCVAAIAAMEVMMADVCQRRDTHHVTNSGAFALTTVMLAARWALGCMHDECSLAHTEALTRRGPDDRWQHRPLLATAR